MRVSRLIFIARFRRRQITVTLKLNNTQHARDTREDLILRGGGRVINTQRECMFNRKHSKNEYVEVISPERRQSVAPSTCLHYYSVG